MAKQRKNSKLIFHGYKNADLVYCNRKAYREFMIYLEWDDDVWTYYQPNISIVLQYRKNKTNYVPIDFKVERVGNRLELVHFCAGDRFDEEVWSRANRYARAINMTFIPFRVIDILEEPRRSNLELLWADARREISVIHFALLNKFFMGASPRTLGELKRFFKSHGFDAGLVHSLIFRRAVCADIESNPLMEETAVTRNLQVNFVPNLKQEHENRDDTF